MNTFQPLATDIATMTRGALSRKDAAHYLSISTRLLDQLAADGKLTRAKIGSKSVFLIEDLDKFLNACRVVNRRQERKEGSN
ncbi:helix-turn-helix domain-containing protein [Pirellulaceae bacterium]|nr:helix-turn-helix domain-containing protein [Pirellulaceae bacterium]